MSKGTILYIGGFELPDKNAAAHRVLSNGKIFRELGYDVVFIGVNKSLNYNSDILTTKKNVQGFECWSVPYPKANIEWINYLTNIDFIKTINIRYINIKVIVAYNYPAFALYRLKKYCVKHHIKIVADCTEWYSTKGSNALFKVIKGLDSFLRMRVIQNKLDGLIVISKYLENYYKKSNNVVRIPPLVDVNEEKWKTVFEYQDTVASDDKWRFVYSGSPGKNKDKTNYIIDALYKLKGYHNYKMEIIGLDKSQFIKYYPEYGVKIKALGNNIDFVGRLSHLDSLIKLKNADYSIFIRDKTRLTMAGFPTKFVESVTCSTPVITNDTSDIKEYFLDSSFGVLLYDSSLDQFTDILKEIIEKDVHVNKNYSKSNRETFHYKRYEKLMENMLNNIFK